MVLGMLTVFTCFIQYFFLYMKHYLALQQIKQCVHLQQLSPRIYWRGVYRFKTQALEMAWAGKPPLPGRKRMKVKTGEASTVIGVPGINRGRPTTAGQTLELIVEGENVYMVDDGEGESRLVWPEQWLIPPLIAETLLNESCAIKPSITETWGPEFVYNLYLRGTGHAPTARAVESDEETEVIVGKDGKETVVVRKPKGPARGVVGEGKIGGRRRKTTVKRKD
jgi:DnaJ family protein C protein 1